MTVFLLSDPHLSLDVPDKKMDRFGEVWVGHIDKIARAWRETVGEKDIVLVPGDISWAKRFESALEDLRFLDALPGTKVLLRGNHDIWWPSSAALARSLPPSLRFLHNNSVELDDFVFFGTRLWDTSEYSVFDIIDWDPKKGAIPEEKKGADLKAQETIYDRELQRLQLSISTLPVRSEAMRIALTHYPPLDHHLNPSRASRLIEKAGARHAVFGHLHSVKAELKGRLFGEKNGVHYHLGSCDYLDFRPKPLF